MFWKERSFSDRERKEDLLEILSVDLKEVKAGALQIWGRNFLGRESSQPKGFRVGVSRAGSSDSPEAYVAEWGEQRSEG